MGQTSLKYLNRVGYNLHWGGLWESKNIYSNTFLKFFFLESLCNKLLKNNVFRSTNIVLTKNTKFFKRNSFLFFDSMRFLEKTITNYSVLNFFNSKLWLLSYQGWVIIIVYLFFPTKSKTKKLSNFNSFKRVKKLKKLKKLKKFILNYNFI